MGPPLVDYAAWSTEHDLRHQIDEAKPSSATPTIGISLVIPVFDPPPSALLACLESLLAQSHPHWEACLVDDGCRNPEVLDLLRTFVDRDKRFRLLASSGNSGIARATNRGIEAATHAWTGFLDHDDRLKPFALSMVARTIATAPDLDVCYSDEEKVSGDDSSPRQPFFKPGWSPVFARGVMYPGHFLCVRTQLLRSVGGADPSFDGIQDYELFLRLSEHTSAIRHVPVTLYEWRMIARSSAAVGDVKGDMEALQQRAVQAHLQRIGSRAQPRRLGGHRVLLEPPPDYQPSALNVVAAPDATLRSLSTINLSPDCKVLVVSTVPGLHLDADLLRHLAFHAEDNPGAVISPTFVSRDLRVVESGCTIARGTEVVPLLRGFEIDSDGYNGSLRCHRETFTVSGRVFAVLRATWDQLRRAVPPEPHDDMSLAEWFIRCGIRPIVLAGAFATLPQHFDDTPAIVARLACPPSLDDPCWNARFDPCSGDYRLTTPTQPAFRYHIDTPIPARTHDGRLRVAGWVAGDPRQPIEAVRLKIDPWIVPSASGEPRPDVSAAYPEYADNGSGFEIRCELPAGAHGIELQFRSRSSDSWHTFALRSLRVDPLPRDAELPATPDDATRLLAFTLGTHPRHAPRPLELPPLVSPEVRVPVASCPRLSIVTPSYGQGRFIRQTLDSVTAANLHDLEHIVQDGGSTDETVEILRSTNAPNLRWWSESDQGQADAINKGFAHTSGAPQDLMAWINADDFYLPGAVDWVRQYFADHPDVDMIYGDRIVVDEAGEEINRWRLAGHDETVLRLNDFVPQETLFWRRRLWDRVGGIDSSFRFAMDWDFLLRCLDAGAVIHHVPVYLGCFRVHAAQKTSAQIASIGQPEIDRLRERSFGRPIDPAELLQSAPLLAFLEKCRGLPR